MKRNIFACGGFDVSLELAPDFRGAGGIFASGGAHLYNNGNVFVFCGDQFGSFLRKIFILIQYQFIHRFIISFCRASYRYLYHDLRYEYTQGRGTIIEINESGNKKPPAWYTYCKTTFNLSLGDSLKFTGGFFRTRVLQEKQNAADNNIPAVTSILRTAASFAESLHYETYVM